MFCAKTQKMEVLSVLILFCILTIGRCSEACSEGQYMNETGQCSACSPPCKACAVISTNCTDCESGQYMNETGQCSACSPPCKACAVISTNCTDCESGQYMNETGQCSACSPPCKACAVISTNCTDCESGQYMNETGQCSACSLPCKACAVISTNCTDCESGHNISRGTCISQCEDGHYIDINSQCSACASHCKSCNDNSTCTQCYGGHYLLAGKTCHPCRSGCNCLSATHCSSCVEGYYKHTINIWGWITTFECRSCSDQCLTCTRLEHCTSCKQKYYLLLPGQCQQCPPSCASCLFLNQCTSCNQGYYLASGHCCNPTCDTCSFSTGDYCTSCKQNYYLASGQCHRCPSTCASCSLSNLCTSCKQGYYLASQECHECRQNCSTCSSADKCHTCNGNYYILSDQCVPCSADCRGQHCDSNGTCSDGCASSDRHGPICDQACSSTFPFCSECNTTSCVLCYRGYYLQLGECASCTDNCIDDADCRHADGACANGCKTGWTGSKCSVECPENCVGCLQYNPNSCDMCKPGFYGTSCQNICKNCESNTAGPICSNVNGTCGNGCIVGHWGPGCDKTCSNGCLKRICYQGDGLCFRCEPDKYGEQCDKNCSTTCAHPGNSSNVCRQTDGVCLFGCSPGEDGQECPPDVQPQTAANADGSSENAGTTRWALSATSIAVIAIAVNIATVIIIIRWRKTHIVGASRKTDTTSEMAGISADAPSYVNMEQLDTAGQRQGADNRTATLHPQSEQGADNRTATLHPQSEQGADNRTATLHPQPDSNENPYLDPSPADSSDNQYLDLTTATDNDEQMYYNSQIGPQTSDNPYMSLDMVPDRDEHQYGDLTQI